MDAPSSTHIQGGIRASFRFALTYGFWDETQRAESTCSKHWLERVGGVLVGPQGFFADRALTEIRNPITIVLLTGLGVLLTSIVFYPEKVRAMAVAVVPVAQKIEAWMLKGTLYGVMQLTLLGLGLRALGRFSNPDLVRAYNQGEIKPLPLGSIRTSAP